MFLLKKRRWCWGSCRDHPLSQRVPIFLWKRHWDSPCIPFILYFSSIFRFQFKPTFFSPVFVFCISIIVFNSEICHQENVLTQNLNFYIMNYNLQRITVDHFTSTTFWRRTKLNFSLLKFLNLARDFQCQYWRSLNRAAPANVNPYWTQSQKPQLCSERKKHPKVFFKERDV